ncbi:unnamed protein product [Didymodactylos carnosus]|uniref:Fringe-like glycosyltransferase domain-containing protein n=2 Tax=Didymodactylos carnosus TaxID=1234261 RepID=A0A814EHW7_9BILA|nr:unnamed protein product [Didymodactylos carnosus]CAF3744335.1 unnamed protein product [Didymodactylos carnosus]
MENKINEPRSGASGTTAVRRAPPSRKWNSNASGIYHRKRCDIIMSTWGSHQIPYGNLHFISDSDDNLLPILQVMNKTADYWKSQRKWILGMLKIFEMGFKQNIKWYMIVDDDGYIVVNNTLALVNQYYHDQMWLLACVACPHPYYHGSSPFFLRICGGGGYLISSEMAKYILPILPKCFNYTSSKWDNGDMKYFDVMFSVCLIELLNVTLTHRNEFKTVSPLKQIKTNNSNTIKFSFNRENLNNPITFHYVKPWQEQLIIWKLYHDIETNLTVKNNSNWLT